MGSSADVKLPVFHIVQTVLGELASVEGDFHLQRPNVPIRDAAGGTIKTVRSSVPDLIFVSGKWGESNITQKNATLHYRFRRGQPFPGEPVLEWTISGERGEIRIISPQTSFIQVGDPSSPRIIEVHDFGTDEVETLEWDWEPWQQELPFPARSIGRLYEDFAEVRGTGLKEKYLNFDIAARRQEELDRLVSVWEA